MDNKIKQGRGMVDVTAKNFTKRMAKAVATIRLGAKAFQALIDGECPKGNVLETARVAGVMAAKSTPSIIPFCHPLELGKVQITFDLDKKNYAVTVSAEVAYQGKTGVEMEALTAVSVSALTIYDMMKWADKGMLITDVMLTRKSGGKSGDFSR